MSLYRDVCLSASFDCPHCRQRWSHGYGEAEPKGKATCPRCAPAFVGGHERALLERDVAEVERVIVLFDDLERQWCLWGDGGGAKTRWRRYGDDCRAWLARAKAVLG